MQTEIVDSAAGLAELSVEWVDLETRATHPTFYASADFVRPWWDAFGHDPDIDLRVVCARQNGRLVGLAPLALHTERSRNSQVRVLRFTGRGDYLNFLVAEEASSQAVLKSLFRTINTAIGWDTISLTNVPGDSPLGNYLFKSDHNEDFTFHVENPYIDLRRYHDFEEFARTSVPDKAQKYRNKLQREIGFEFRVVQNDDTIFERIADLHRLERDHLINVHKRTERHSLFDDPDRRRHIEQIFATTDRPVTFVYLDDNDDLLADPNLLPRCANAPVVEQRLSPSSRRLPNRQGPPIRHHAVPLRDPRRRRLRPRCRAISMEVRVDQRLSGHVPLASQGTAPAAHLRRSPSSLTTWAAERLSTQP